jgi:predicted transcriptional regulator
MEVLQHVWELGEATVADVRERILESRSVAYTTVMTVLKKLTDKGFLRFEEAGATYVYSPARDPEDVRQEILRELVDKVFLGSRTALVQTLVGGEGIAEGEREEILRLVRSLEGEGTPDDA